MNVLREYKGKIISYNFYFAKLAKWNETWAMQIVELLNWRDIFVTRKSISKNLKNRLYESTFICPPLFEIHLHDNHLEIKNMDPELEKIRQSRMQQLQGIVHSFYFLWQSKFSGLPPK